MGLKPSDMDPATVPDPTGRAGRVIDFVETLTLWEGERAGQPFRLEPYQQYITRRIYGPVDDWGKPLIKTAAVWLPRGNTKTTLGAGFSLAHFIGPEAERGGQVAFAAADRENAGIAFRHAHAFVEGDEVYQNIVEKAPSRKELRYPSARAILRALSSEAYSKHGMNVSFFLADEIHAWPEVTARPLWDAITDSMIKRQHALTIIISTAGEGDAGLAREWWDYSHAVAEGRIDDPSFCPIICAADRDADWRDETVWRECNPGIDAGILNLDVIRQRAARAQHSIADQTSFKRYYLNIWQEGATEPWLDIAYWDRCPRTSSDHPVWDSASYIGVDLSSNRDLTAAVQVAEDENEEGDRTWHVRGQFWLPRMELDKKSDLDQANYLQWEEEGSLTVTDGDVVDYKAVEKHLEELWQEYWIQEVGIDAWNSEGITTRMADKGVDMTKVGMAIGSLSAAYKELERAIMDGRLYHDGNPVMRYCFANAIAWFDANENIKIVKDRKQTRRVDGVVATAIAIKMALAGDPPDDLSWLNEIEYV